MDENNQLENIPVSSDTKGSFQKLSEYFPQPASNITSSVNFDALRSKDTDEGKVKLDGLKSFYSMRDRWSKFLMICLAIILSFNVVLVALVGRKILYFEDEWFLRIVLGTNLADIIGLVYLVVRFLFSHPPTNSKS